jgi:hypothetical protein
VTKIIAPKKKINCFVDPDISPMGNFFPVVYVLKESLSKKRLDKTIRSIPRQRGNMPVPALLKVPIGIFKERRVVIPPKRKITIPPIISSLFNSFPN